MKTEIELTNQIELLQLKIEAQQKQLDLLHKGFMSVCDLVDCYKQVIRRHEEKENIIER